MLPERECLFPGRAALSPDKPTRGVTVQVRRSPARGNAPCHKNTPSDTQYHKRARSTKDAARAVHAHVQPHVTPT